LLDFANPAMLISHWFNITGLAYGILAYDEGGISKRMPSYNSYDLEVYARSYLYGMPSQFLGDIKRSNLRAGRSTPCPWCKYQMPRQTLWRTLRLWNMLNQCVHSDPLLFHEMSATVVIIIGYILDVLLIILMSAAEFIAWMVCHIFKEVNGYSNV
jgi:hypothetical protein